MKKLILCILTATLFVSCDNSSLTSSNISKIIDEDISEQEWICAAFEIGKIQVPFELGSRSHKSHFAEDQTLCTMTLTETETGEEKDIAVVCKPCFSCFDCIERLKKEGLVDYTVVKDGDKYITLDVSLTEKADEYVMFSTPDQVFVKYAKIETTEVYDILKMENNRATCKYTSSFYDLTPFAELYGSKDGAPRVYSLKEPERVREDKFSLVYYEDKGWSKYKKS